MYEADILQSRYKGNRHKWDKLGRINEKQRTYQGES